MGQPFCCTNRLKGVTVFLLFKSSCLGLKLWTASVGSSSSVSSNRFFLNYVSFTLLPWSVFMHLARQLDSCETCKLSATRISYLIRLATVLLWLMYRSLNQSMFFTGCNGQVLGMMTIKTGSSYLIIGSFGTFDWLKFDHDFNKHKLHPIISEVTCF